MNTKHIIIPKIIHYCWLSDDPIPVQLQECMNSWKEKLPDYECMHWSFDRFDKASSQWVSQAFDNKKYAFAADYIRLYALYNYGGIYLDMDVEVVKSYDEFLELREMICFENSNDGKLEVAAFGVEPKSPWIKKCLDYYKGRSFVNEDGIFDTKVLPSVIRDVLIENRYELVPVKDVEEAANVNGLNQIPVFPFEYFSPKSLKTGKIESTKNTFSIHHFAGTWLPWYSTYEQKICNKLGIPFHDVINNIIKIIRGERKL